jgi:hypothetical protein
MYRFIGFHNSVDGLVRHSLALNVGLNDIVKFVEVLVLCRKNSSFTQPIMILVIGLNIRKYFFNQFFFLRHTIAIDVRISPLTDRSAPGHAYL